MDTTQSKGNVDGQNAQKLFCKQPITCPWINSQPYPSALNKNRTCDSTTAAKSLPNIPLSMDSRTVNEKTCPSLQHSSSQFFYFLRLMQLFPETHPATLHTVLCLCKNDFFCAVDKLLYAKRCKALYSRSQGMFRRCSIGRSHPYCGYGGVGKGMSQQEQGKSQQEEGEEVSPNTHKDMDLVTTQAEAGNSLEKADESNDVLSAALTDNKPHELKVNVTATAPASICDNENNHEATADVTSHGIFIQAQDVISDKAAEA